LSDLISILTVCWYILEIFLGVGFIIFVHELGHFAVAKFCGVKCEKFYLGFDIGGWKFCKFRWGETEYGIGILPLGGYVKMLGQEDNPAKLKEEIERAKLQQGAVEGQPRSTTTAGAEDGPARIDIDIAQAEKALYDPRSYLAKSVPKRMAIISAGVIMNVIFAFLMAAVAYALGVEQAVSVVGKALPGGAAWRADLRPDDVILQIDGKDIDRFDDIRKSVPFTDAAQGVSLTIQRPGEKKPFTKVLHPDRTGDLPMIGLTPQKRPVLFQSESDEQFLQPGSSAVKIADRLQGGDRIAAIEGEKIERYSQVEAFMVNHPDEPLQITLERLLPDEEDRPAKSETIEAVLPPQPMRTLGLVMEMGEIAAVQDDSPAKEAGLQAGDRILKIDGEPDVDSDVDPMRLPDKLRRRAGETITLTVEREKSDKELKFSVKLRRVDWAEPSLDKKSPVSIPQLGIAYRVRNCVAEVEPGSPAAKAGIARGATVLSAVIIPPKDKNTNPKIISQNQISYDFEKTSWPDFFFDLQIVDPESTVKLKLKDKAVEMRSADAVGWFNPDRGLEFEPMTFVQRADSLGEALRLGAAETGDALTMVLRILRGMGSGQISPTNLGGPGTIFYVAYLSAKHGFASLLIFLTLLSANLAVLNVLPIPMLDGGHLVFLTYEGIRGKPANERVQIVLSVIGLFLLLGLMIFVIGMDIQRLLVSLFG
jgi:regulator of sigma E protease